MIRAREWGAERSGRRRCSVPPTAVTVRRGKKEGSPGLGATQQRRKQKRRVGAGGAAHDGAAEALAPARARARRRWRPVDEQRTCAGVGVGSGPGMVREKSALGQREGTVAFMIYSK
jgi:hypothetical protein